MLPSPGSPEDSRPAVERCLVTQLTATGRGAIAVVAVAASGVLELVTRFFQPASGRSLAEIEHERIVYGRWKSSADSSEDVIVRRCGDTEIEIHCHGGVAASRAIIEALVSAGATEISSGEWAACRDDDPLRVAAHLALSHARTARTAAILLDQYRGALRTALELIRQDLADHNHGSSRAQLQRLLQLAPVGLHLTTPWRVICAGPPNVGKSSLINLLLGYQRSIVFDEPGTTRDLLFATTALDGWPVELVDTAGLRASTDAVEAQGVARASSLLPEADLVLLVFDATCGWTAIHEQMVAASPAALVVANKHDLCPEPAWPLGMCRTSAVTGFGLESLIEAILSRLISTVPSRGEAVPFTALQVEALQRAQDLLDQSAHAAAASVLQALMASGSAE